MKTHKKLKMFLAIVVVIAIIFAIWWITPKTFPTQDANDITKIECFNGTTGQTVIIEDEETINYIVSGLQSTKYKVDSLALGIGTMFNLTFYSEFGSSETLILQPNSKIKQGIYFYVPQGDYSLDELYDFLENANGFTYKDELLK